MPKIINANITSASVSDFKGKVLIFYSWTTYCGPCLASFPKLDSLQKKFDGQIQIMMVGYEEESRLRGVFERMKKTGKNISLPSAIVDSELFKRFLNTDGSLGGVIWIDKSGTVLGRTPGEQINTANIEAALRGSMHRSIRTVIKSTVPKIHIGASKPLLTEYNGVNENSLGYQSIIAKYNDFFSTNTTYYHIPSQDNPNGIMRAFNTSVTGLFQTAYSGDTGSVYFENIKYKGNFLHQFPLFRTKVYSAKKTDYAFTTADDSLKRSRLYSYELIMPGATIEQMFTAMQQDLERYFPLKASIEKGKETCYVLVRTKDTGLHTKGSSPLFEKDNFGIHMVNQPMSKLVTALSYYLTTPEVPLIIDETGITEKIDISLVADLMRNLFATRAALQKHGLDLVTSEREVDILVLKDKE